MPPQDTCAKHSKMDTHDAESRLTLAHPLMLGVDGGGTKTQAWLARIDDQGQPQVLGRGIAGSSNKVAIGFESAMANLGDAIKQAFADAQLAMSPIASAAFALAGSGTEEVRQQILDFVKQNFLVESASVIHDGQAVLQAGTPDGWGIAMIAGTGTVAYGANLSGKTAVVGGWGYWFGDEGSAYWLGQSALRAISHAADGRADPTALTAVILNKLETREPREILAALLRKGDVRREIANLAELVCQVAEQQDDVANQIVNQAAQHWSRHIECLAQQLVPDEPFPLALAGGVLCGSSYARGRLIEQLEAKQLRTSSVEFVSEPVVGCVQLALKYSV